MLCQIFVHVPLLALIIIAHLAVKMALVIINCLIKWPTFLYHRV